MADWRDHMPEVDLGTYAGPVLLKLDACPGVGTPDLSDPQGFGFALRWFWRNQTCPPMDGGLPSGTRWERAWMAALGNSWPGMVMRHVEGATTDADRLALARACEEVARG